MVRIERLVLGADDVGRLLDEAVGKHLAVRAHLGHHELDDADILRSYLTREADDFSLFHVDRELIDVVFEVEFSVQLLDHVSELPRRHVPGAEDQF